MGNILWQDTTTAATTLHKWGANVLFVSHHEQEKKPLHRWKPYQVAHQSDGDFDRILWVARRVLEEAGLNGPIPAFGVINGPGGWRTVDFDKSNTAPVGSFLELAGLPTDYPWVCRSGSGKGYGLTFICHEEPAPPLPTGFPWYYPRDGHEFDHFELRWQAGQTILPPSLHPSGNRYTWLNEPPTQPPATLPWTAIHRAVSAIGVMREYRQSSTRTEQTYQGPRDTVIDDIKAKLDTEALAQRVFKGKTQREGDETRILGHGGLHVNVKKGVFNSIRDGEAGVRGDAIDLVGMSLFGSSWNRHNSVMFRNALEQAAREAGVELRAQQ